MPFDSNETADLLTFTPGHTALRKLAVLLRREMPRSFTWNFNKLIQRTPCGTVGCAIGLAFETWPELERATELSNDSPDREKLAAAFGMTLDALGAIFVTSWIYGKPYHDITPQDVARKIDDYLALVVA